MSSWSDFGRQRAHAAGGIGDPGSRRRRPVQKSVTMRSHTSFKMIAQVHINYSHMKLRYMVVAQRMFISVKESQTEGHVCNLGHDSTKMGYELKVIMLIYLHKCSAVKARVLYGSQRQYDL